MKHHYIPQGYLRQWTDAGGELWEYSRPHRRVIVKRRFTAGTGYVPGLYTMVDAEAEPEKVELKFLQQIDAFGAECIQTLLTNREQFLDPDLREKWSLFILSLIQRNPDKIAFLNSHAEGDGGVANPEVGLSALAAQMLIDISTLKNVIGHMQRMTWGVVTVGGDRDLMTSDRPVAMSDGLDHDEGNIILPISPRTVFLAVTNREFGRFVQANLESEQFVEQINKWVIQHSYRFAYATDNRQSRFVEEFMPSKDKPFVSPILALRAQRP